MSAFEETDGKKKVEGDADTRRKLVVFPPLSSFFSGVPCHSLGARVSYPPHPTNVPNLPLGRT